MSDYFESVSHRDWKCGELDGRGTVIKVLKQTQSQDATWYNSAEQSQPQESQLKCGLMLPSCFVLGSGLVQGSQMTATKNLFYLCTVFPKGCSPFYSLSLFFSEATKSVFCPQAVQVHTDIVSEAKNRAINMLTVLIGTVELKPVKTKLKVELLK